MIAFEEVAVTPWSAAVTTARNTYAFAAAVFGQTDNDAEVPPTYDVFVGVLFATDVQPKAPVLLLTCHW